MDAEIIIVGGGFSGASAANVLSDQGISVITIDRHKDYPNFFRAEKIEPNQASALSKFGLLEARRPLVGPIGKTINYKDGVSEVFDTKNQFGMSYSDTVNSFREVVKSKSQFICSTVVDIRLSESLQTVVTKGGEYSCRLIVLAAGGSEVLLKKIGIERRNQPSLTSFSFAFDIVLSGEDSFPYSGLNYFLTNSDKTIDYATIFKIGETFRVNVFTQWPVGSSLITDLMKSPKDFMDEYFPDLEGQVGPYEIVSKVQAFPTAFYRLSKVKKPGIVVIGDDYQSVSPATGSGLDKVVTDVDRLCNTYVPLWLKTEGMKAQKIKQFYDDAEKKSVDDSSLSRWISYRDNHRGFWGRQMSKFEIRYKRYFNLW